MTATVSCTCTGIDRFSLLLLSMLTIFLSLLFRLEESSLEMYKRSVESARGILF